ncbi:unnamed protein product [Schistosoma mattheei]|uniref:Uncharacterized protein n=1 Tax=Schistosoma mattheei TaxID=31246 RepID=A0AA85BSG6_9TREM|nr:unnamed protein product [Schistosoma mattheei]
MNQSRHFIGSNPLNANSSLIRSKSFQHITTNYHKSSIMKLWKNEHWNFIPWKSDVTLFQSDNTLEMDQRSWLYLDYNTKYIHETTV